MAEQEALPAEMTESEAADAMVKAGLFAEPTEEKKKLPPKDPATGKFVKAAPAEGDEEGAGSEDVSEKTEIEDETEPEEEEAPPVKTLKVKLDGMEQDLAEEEVTAGYLRQNDYTKKTQAVAEERKAVAAERAEMREAMEYYLSRTQAIEEALEALVPSKEPDWEALAKELPPEEFGQRFTAWKKGQDQKQRLSAEQTRVRELHEQETTRDRATRLAKEHELLEVAIPELKDPEKGKVLREDLLEFAKSVHRFTDDDIANIEDHRALVILNESRLWRESQKRRPTVEAKVEKAIAGLKPSGSAPKPVAKVAAQAKARFLQTNSVEDAAEAMRAAKLFG